MDIEWDTNVSGGGEESGWWAWGGSRERGLGKGVSSWEWSNKAGEAMKLRGIAISLLTKMNKDGQDDRHVEGMDGYLYYFEDK